MASKRIKEVIEQERRRKNGVRRWRSEVRRFGFEKMEPLIPRGIRPLIVGTEVQLDPRLQRLLIE